MANLFFACSVVLIGLAVAVFCIEVLRKSTPDTTTENKGWGWWAWIVGEILIGIAVILCFVGFCLSFD